MKPELTDAYREKLIDECFKQETDARINEYRVTDHAEKAKWHRLRWSWMNKAQELMEGRK